MSCLLDEADELEEGCGGVKTMIWWGLERTTREKCVVCDNKGAGRQQWPMSFECAQRKERGRRVACNRAVHRDSERNQFVSCSAAVTRRVRSALTMTTASALCDIYDNGNLPQIHSTGSTLKLVLFDNSR